MNIRYFLFLLLSIFYIYSVYAFSKDDIISPSEGEWNNIQALVLDTGDGSELYYSLTGTDPLVSGFAYDGPVVIEQTGSIRLRITALSKEGTRSDFNINYTVKKIDYHSDNAEAETFVQTITQNPLRRYISGTILSIPSTFTYSMVNDISPSLQGTRLSLSSKNLLDRYIPCTLKDNNYSYHIVIHTVAAKNNSVARPRNYVPFELTDWNTFTFTGENLIYQLDDNYWSADREPKLIDRNVTHTVRWQSVNYQKGNKVYSVRIPPAPRLSYRKGTDTPIVFYLQQPFFEGLRYTLGPASNKSPSFSMQDGLYNEIPVDILQGDFAKGHLALGVYYDGIYQGDLYAAVDIDKCPPSPPIITSSASSENNHFSRSSVNINISKDSLKDTNIYYSIYSEVKPDSSLFKATSLENIDFDESSYKLYSGNAITLRSASSNAVFYALRAYTIDEAGNKSKAAEYKIIIDEYNYYLSSVNEDSIDTISDENVNSMHLKGTYTNPFNSLKETINAINRVKNACVHINGDIYADEIYNINSNCIFISNKKHIIVAKDALIKINDAKVTFNDCIIEKTGVEGSLFESEGGTLSLNNCELIGRFSNFSSMIKSKNTEISLNNTGITLQAELYAYAISAINSKISLINARLTSNSTSSICINVIDSNLFMEKSFCTIRGRIGRCMELINSKATLKDNRYAIRLEQEGEALWKDVNSVILVNSNNQEVKF